MEFTTVHRLLLAARARRCHTMKAAAKTSGVSLPTWKRAERGQIPRSATLIGKLAKYAKCDPSVLIDGASYVSGDAPQAAVIAVESGVPHAG